MRDKRVTETERQTETESERDRKRGRETVRDKETDQRETEKEREKIKEKKREGKKKRILLVAFANSHGINIAPAESFPGGSDSKESACNAGDLGSIPGLGRSPGGGHGNPFQYSCLVNPHGKRSLAGYSPGDRKESGMTD